MCIRDRPKDTARIIAALAAAIEDQSSIRWHDVNATDVGLLAIATGTTAYDASYLWLAGSLGADLVTLDKGLMRVVEE